MHDGTSAGGRAEIRKLNPSELGPASGFSHVVVSDGLAWIAGQTATDRNGRIIARADIVAQFQAAIKNLALALRAAGCAPADVLKITFYVKDVGAYRANLKPIGNVYRSVFGHHFPAATLIGVDSLFDPVALIEIDCVARIPMSTA